MLTRSFHTVTTTARGQHNGASEKIAMGKMDSSIGLVRRSSGSVVPQARPKKKFGASGHEMFKNSFFRLGRSSGAAETNFGGLQPRFFYNYFFEY